MYILGLGGSNHDFSSCVLDNNNILCMIEEERPTRKKHGEGLGIELAKGISRNYCYDHLNVKEEDLSLIVGNDILNPVMYRRMNKDVVLIDHHLSHAASAFYTSEFDEAAILIVDAVGSKREKDGKTVYDSASFYYGKRSEINSIKKISGVNLKGTDMVENSIGIFYSLMTNVIGFGEHQDGKTMGLAPYGTNKLLKNIAKQVKFEDEGEIVITKQNYEKLLEFKEIVDVIQDKDEKFQYQADLAWAAQDILEKCMSHFCRHLRKVTDTDNICIAGGVALNSVANYKLYKEKKFKNFFIPPACGDSGTSIGSALYGYYSILGNERIIPH